MPPMYDVEKDRGGTKHMKLKAKKIIEEYLQKETAARTDGKVDFKALKLESQKGNDP